jgi:hypothetical protein
MLITMVLAPISFVTGYGIVVSFRQKHIDLDKNSRTGTLTIDYTFFRKVIPFHFDDVDAVLLETESGGPPPGVTANGREGTIEALIIFRNGMRKTIARGFGKNFPPNDVKMLHDELEQAIMVGQERPVEHFTERVFISKYPTNDGIGIIEVSKKREANMVMSLLFGIITTIFVILFTWIGVLTEPLFAIIGDAVFAGIFGSVSLITGIIYLTSKKAKTVITIDEANGVLDVVGGDKVHHATYQIHDIEGTNLGIQRKVTYTKNGGTIVTFAYFPTLVMVGGPQVRIYKSDRFLEGIRVGKLLNIFIGHALAIQKDPSVPPLPVMTYDELYKDRDANKENVVDLD